MRTLMILLLGLMACQSINKETDPDFLEGNQYARDGLFREAISSYKASLKKNNDNLSAHRNLGLALVRVSSYKDAAAHLLAALPAYDNDYATNFHLAEAFRGFDRYADAIYYYERSLRLKPHAPSALKSLAWSYYNTHYYSAALKIVKELLHIDAKDFEATVIHSRILLKLKEYPKALAILEKQSIPKDPERAAQLASLKGEVYYSSGKITEAGKMFKDALKLSPLMSSALLGYGKCLLKDGRRKQAADLIERALRIRPQLVEAYYYLGEAYEPSDKKKSRHYYTEFKGKVSTDPEYLSSLPALSKKIRDLSN